MVGYPYKNAYQQDNFELTKHRIEHSYDRNGRCVWCTKSKLYHSSPPMTPYCISAPPNTVEFWKRSVAGTLAREAAAKTGLDAFHRGYKRGGFV